MSSTEWIIVAMIAVIMVLIPIAAYTVRKTKDQAQDDLDSARAERAKILGDLLEVISDVQLLTTALSKTLVLHKPYGIYEGCGHDHRPDEDGVEDIEWVGLVCAAGLLYWICEVCCVDELQEQRPECVSHHHHDRDVDHRCPTVTLLAEVINGDSRHPVG